MIRIILWLAIFFLSWQQAGAAQAVPPEIGAQAAILMDARSQYIYYAKERDKRMYPASTTKIMTLLVALKRGDPNSVVTVDPKASASMGSCLGLQAGEQMELKELLYGMMLVSGNDAAEAVAVHVGRNRPQFIRWMNEEAARIGVNGTRFSNPHGLPDPSNHYTTAFDLALITAEALNYPDFRRIVATKERTVASLNGGLRQVKNSNALLDTFYGVNGVKTGYTKAAGYCLVATARRGDTELIAVILNSPNRYQDAARLLEYGFNIRGTVEKGSSAPLQSRAGV
ncbi:D-alanyl-D-alanine carboxypeptidase family protein [Acetonema longum]|uniref:Serine-type D-Ala-D-Ala carboxypeptidase n=1 Tax=Acetonema longum DSM 6540 TaxID=1009370 RepID=F7NGJ2_9FIRM|nr:D-alanyl-D-alanine carboxypeptidase family protein [Acetonema longum]EGO64796.1 Serine-type D-Ala-D-Ala carboxypeptidase [Acetonema longum DSM 6540]